ncbi:MAG: FKBP-type peptidyl-prolyl cis-trans isomerase [Rikenellaceae bacterium]
MTRFKKIFLSVIATVCLISCAVNNESAYEALTTASFEAWMAKYAPNAELTDEYVYIEFFQRKDNWEELTVPDTDSSWIKMSYTGYTLQNNIFSTRDSLTAKMMGTWLYTTHFADDFEPFVMSTTLCPGFYYGLSHMREGDSARIYIPVELGYSTYTMDQNSGYAGTTSSYLSTPIIFDVTVSEVVNNAYYWERDNINAWVEKNWGMTEADTIVEGLYMRIIEENPLGDTVSTDSTYNYNVSTYFPGDGQLISTTLESVAVANGYYDSSTSYDEQEMTSSLFESTTSTYYGFALIIQEMRKGETAEAIIPSWLAEGIAGSQDATPEILPYQTQRVILTLLDDEEDEDEEEEEDEE